MVACRNLMPAGNVDQYRHTRVRRFGLISNTSKDIQDSISEAIFLNRNDFASLG